MVYALTIPWWWLVINLASFLAGVLSCCEFKKWKR